MNCNFGKCCKKNTVSWKKQKNVHKFFLFFSTNELCSFQQKNKCTHTYINAHFVSGIMIGRYIDLALSLTPLFRIEI